MIDAGKRNILGIGINVIDYEGALDRVQKAAEKSLPLKVTALAVHGVMTGALDAHHRYRLNNLDLVMPDGQPVRWALNWLHGAKLGDRVYGPNFTLAMCERAAQTGLKVYFYGSSESVLNALTSRLKTKFPELNIVGSRPSLFRRSSDEEKAEICKEIKATGAELIFVGLGCPRQEVWVHEYAELVGVPVIAVGAAFDFHAGTLSQAPDFLQRNGLEWLYRLVQEPKRLWRRYLFLNPAYLSMLAAQFLKLRTYSDRGTPPPQSENYA